MKLDGTLAERGFPELVQELHERRWTGTVTLTQMGIGKSVTVKDGRLVFASSSDPDDRLGELLLRQGKVKLWDLVEAKRAVGSGKRLGNVLVDRGVISPAELIGAVTGQVQEILYSLFQLTEGRYRLDANPIPTETITLKISTPSVILEGIRRIQAWSRIERGIGGVEALYSRAAHYETVLPQLALSFERLSLLTELNGVKDVRALCEGSNLPSFEVCQTLWAFRVIGIVRLACPEPAKVQEDEDGLAFTLAEPPQDAPAASPATAAGAPAKKRVLVVGLEDDVFARIDPLLSRAVFAVERAPEARAAATVCGRILFDLVIARHPLAGMALKDFIAALWKQTGASTACHLLVLAEAGRLGELTEYVREGQSLVLPVTEPGKVLEEVASRLLGVAPRTSARLVIRLVVQLDGGKQLLVSQTENISEAGMLLRTDSLYPLGTRVTLEANLPGDRAPIQAEAEVVRHALAGLEGVQGLGLRLSSVKGDGLARLRDYIAVKRSAGV
jgi:hypothetical protein